MARPPKVLNYDQIQELAGIQCTEEEIAQVIGFTSEGFRKRKKRDKLLVGALENGRGLGRQSLRREQYKLAKKGNATMLIWLGKQYLGQSDKQQTELTGAGGGPVQVESTVDERSIIAYAEYLRDREPVSE